LHPVAVNAAVLRTGRDVVEHQLVRALVAVAQGQVDDVAHIDVVAEANALDDPAIAHVEAGNDAAAQHGTCPVDASAARPSRASSSASSSVNHPSSSARPSTAAAQPAARAAAISATSRMPPDACSRTCGATCRS